MWRQSKETKSYLVDKNCKSLEVDTWRGWVNIDDSEHHPSMFQPVSVQTVQFLWSLVDCNMLSFTVHTFTVSHECTEYSNPPLKPSRKMSTTFVPQLLFSQRLSQISPASLFGLVSLPLWQGHDRKAPSVHHVMRSCFFYWKSLIDWRFNSPLI